jgi:hypothetical protein
VGLMRDRKKVVRADGGRAYGVVVDTGRTHPGARRGESPPRAPAGARSFSVCLHVSGMLSPPRRGSRGPQPSGARAVRLGAVADAPPGTL